MRSSLVRGLIAGRFPLPGSIYSVIGLRSIFSFRPTPTAFRGTAPTTAAGRATRAANSAAFIAAAAAATAAPLFATANAAYRAFFLVNRHLDSRATLQHHLDGRAGDIDGDDLAWSAGGIQKRANLGHILPGLNIILILIRETAEQAAADPRNLRGIER